MSAILAALVVGLLGIFAMIIIGIGGFAMFFVLLAGLGWHPPGWLLSPGAHALNAMVTLILELCTVIITVAAIAYII